MPSQRGRGDVVHALRAARRAKRPATLLIGAGCSATAGIPTAHGIVERIAREFPAAYERAGRGGYAACMNELSEGVRRDIIREYVAAAKINWAHIAIAQLLKEGFVGQVLTTNFDPLLQRACALTGVSPAVYDLASAPRLVHHFVEPPAIFHLHGQHSGFMLLNTEAKMTEHARVLTPLFDRLGGGQPWIVAGYSGVTDPVFSAFANIPHFDYDAFWIGYEDSVDPHVEKLVTSEKGLHWIPGQDADTFFSDVARELECFPPLFLGQPFTHLQRELEGVAEWPFQLHFLGQPSPDASVDFLEAARELVRSAAAHFEDGKRISRKDIVSGTALRALYYYHSGDYDRAIRLAPRRSLDQKLEIFISLALSGKAAMLLRDVRNGERVTQEPRDLIERALRRFPENSEARFMQGLILAMDADLEEDPAVKLRIFERAIKKFKEGHEAAPAWPAMYGVWGYTLAQIALLNEKAGQVGPARRARKALETLQHEYDEVIRLWEKQAPGAGEFFHRVIRQDPQQMEHLRDVLREAPLRLMAPKPKREVRKLAPTQTRLPGSEEAK